MKRNLDEFRGIVVERENLNEEIVRLQRERFAKDLEIIECMVEHNMFHCLSINWNRLRRSL